MKPNRIIDDPRQRFLDDQDENLVKHCRRCKRPLRSDRSKKAGIGPACRKIEQAQKDKP